MTDSLRKRAERGAMWSFVEAAGSQMVYFVISVVLARLLLPRNSG